MSFHLTLQVFFSLPPVDEHATTYVILHWRPPLRFFTSFDNLLLMRSVCQSRLIKGSQRFASHRRSANENDFDDWFSSDASDERVDADDRDSGLP